MDKKILVIEPRGGLGNRLLAISSAFNLAKDCGIDQISMLWNNINECGCNYEDVFYWLPEGCKAINLIFINDSYKAMFLKGKIISCIRKAIQRGKYKMFKLKTKADQFEANTIKTTAQQQELKDKVLSHKGKYVFIESYNKFYGDVDLSKIEFNKEITEKVAAFKEKMGEYDAMHIRRTDNVEAIKNSPTELFYDKISQLLKDSPKAKIYIATDDSGILEDLKNRYPDNIVSEATGAVSRRNAEGIRFALYEMLILAGAKTLYASFFSTFSQIANCIGGNDMVVLKVESKE